MATTTTEDYTRLIKFLGMLGSNQDGERASAALKASEWLIQHGLTWTDVIVPTVTPKGNHQQSSNHQSTGSGKPRSHTFICVMADKFLDAGIINDWEYDFLSSVVEFASLSPKQQAIVDRIERKATAAGFW